MSKIKSEDLHIIADEIPAMGISQYQVADLKTKLHNLADGKEPDAEVTPEPAPEPKTEKATQTPTAKAKVLTGIEKVQK